MKQTAIVPALLLAFSASGEGEVNFNGVFCTSGEYAGEEFTRSRIVNYGWTAAKTGAATSTLTAAAYWSDGKEVSGEKDYAIIGQNGRSATYTGDTVFNGKSLALGAVGGNAGYLVPVGSSALTVEGDGLVINNGGMVWHNSYGKNTSFNGRLTVNASRAQPASFYDYWSGKANHTMNFTTLTGASNSGIKFTGQSHTTTETYKNKLFFSGDWSGFYGLLTVATYYDKVTFSDIECPGDFEYKSGTVLSIDAGGDDYTGSFRFGSMALKSTTSIILGIGEAGNATMSTDALMVEGEGKLPLSVVLGALPHTKYPLQLDKPARDAVLVDLPEAAKPILETFDVSTANSASLTEQEKKYAKYRSLVGVSLNETVADGRRRLVCTIPKYTYTTQRGQNQVSSILDHPEYWQGVGEGEAFRPDTAYFVFDDPDSSDGTVTLTQNKDIVFNGGPLCLLDGYIITGGRMTFNDLRILPSVVLQFGGNGSVHEFNGNITVYDRDKNGTSGSVQLWSRQNGVMTVNSALHGNGKIVIASASWSADEKQKNRTVVFTGDNTDYAGKIELANYADGFKTKLKITDGKSLGGALDAFAYDAVNLKNRSELEVGATTALSETTRGIFAESGSSISVPNEGDVFSVGSVLTCSGTVKKTGDGVLSLSRSARSGDANAVLAVTAGALEVTARGALEGINADFAAGTSLRFNADNSDAEMLASGLDLVSGSIAHADGKLNIVCLTKNSVDDIKKKSLALFTGDAQTVAALADSVSVKIVDESGDERRGALEVKDAADGAKTLVASFDKRGVMMILK